MVNSGYVKSPVCLRNCWSCFTVFECLLILMCVVESEEQNGGGVMFVVGVWCVVLFVLCVGFVV